MALVTSRYFAVGAHAKQRLYKRPKDIVATNVMRETHLTQKRLTKNLKSTDGHVIIRLYPGGNECQVFVTESKNESDDIVWMSDRYQSRIDDK